MSYAITNGCIACDRCHSLCPTDAIQVVEQQRWIDPERCNNCVGSYGVPQCAAACPSYAGCLPKVSAQTSSAGDYWDSWFRTYNDRLRRLQTAKHNPYWERWFAVYADKLASLLVAKQQQQLV